MNYIVYSEYSFEAFVEFSNEVGNLDKTLTYLDARSLSHKEIETRWRYEDNLVFFLGTNGMVSVDLEPENVWIFSPLDKDDEIYCLDEFIDIEKFEIKTSQDAYKHFRSGRFDGHQIWDWNDYMNNNVWNKNS